MSGTERIGEELKKLAKSREKYRRQRLETEPETTRSAILSGRETALHEALRPFEKMDGVDMPKWQVCLESEAGDGGWYYVDAFIRSTAIKKAKREARVKHGSGPFQVLKVGGPIAE